MEVIANRKYSISIIADKKAPQIADNSPRDFDCMVSEPSTWLLPGTTEEKGLSFLDKSGDPLQSSIFKHLAYFQTDKDQAEEAAIEQLVYGILFEHYHFEKNDVKVMVTKYK